ncbi:MAG: helix-turn-helix transcriptional regulator [Prevotella sp.]|nr:helix-turn-helix transcriptional regulator [Prevotella sp.]
MDMLEYTSPQFILFCMLYGGAAVVSAMLCLYLLLCRGNAIAPDITPPARLRRWAAAFFGIAALGHLWWYIFFILSGDVNSWAHVACVVLDCILTLTTVFGTMLSMLQDRRRPLWPFVTAMTPIVILGGLQIARPGTDFLTPALAYTLVLYVFFSIYMTVAVRQYGRWLRDNYADLEHKEVWASHTLLILFLLLVVIYGFTTDGPSFFLLRIADFVLFGLLLWRVETLPQLEAAATDEEDSLPEPEASQDPATDLQGAGNAAAGTQKPEEEPSTPLALRRGLGAEALSNIGDLLKENCEKTGLYLMNDLTLAQLSTAVGVNRSYLSQYFSCQGMNYNTYINGLRINHFVSLYQKAASSQQYFTAQQLAQQCGYRSYSTFSTAFKQRMGQSVSAWMREMGGVEIH